MKLKTQITMTPLQVAIAIEALEGMDFSFNGEIQKEATTLFDSLKNRHEGLERFWVDKNLWKKINSLGGE
tara:strand:- start:880 stop:1089 length:210 start_codon:yes stop_codon:yes gene_type:complete